MSIHAMCDFPITLHHHLVPDRDLSQVGQEDLEAALVPGHHQDRRGCHQVQAHLEVAAAGSRPGCAAGLVGSRCRRSEARTRVTIILCMYSVITV